jgi:hexosaminidase
VYAQFSLHPESEELAGLVQRSNETLSRADFEDLQQHCAQRGITVIPEIEAPGHCLAITKWKPELALATKDLLNLTHPDSIPTVKQIWAEFLPWFQTKEVHIGADEYDASLADDYIRFVNEMSTFVNNTSGGAKKIRIWGTDEPSPTNLTISLDVVVQHWQFGQSDPLQLQETGYQLVNSQDYWAYMSLKNDHTPINPAPYPQFFNVSRVVPPQSPSWQWQPNFFNASAANVTEVLPADASGNKGAILAAWNDNGPDATTQLEAYYAMRRGIPLVAAKAWNGVPLTSTEDTLGYWADHAPGQNLDRRTPFTSWSKGNTSTVAGNGTAAAAVALGGGSKGMNYTLTLSVTGPFVLSSADTRLSLIPSSSSSSASATAAAYQLVFAADGWPYPLRSVAETEGFDAGLPGRIWANTTTSTHAPVHVTALPVEVTVTGDSIGGARVWLDGVFAGRFEVFVFGGRNTLFSWSQMAFVAPLQTLEGGGVQSIQLRDGVWPPDGSSGGGGGSANATATPTGTASSAVPTAAAAIAVRADGLAGSYIIGIMSIVRYLLLL